MIIYNLNIKRISIAPDKADAPLQVNTNTVLTLPVSLQLFQVI